MKELADENDSWYQSMMAEMPKFNVSYFDLTFNRSRSLYKPGREVESRGKTYGTEPASDNMVYTDLVSKKVKAVKQIYEDKFLVQDSMRKIQWKIKDELRTIANFKCRKAVGVICDSVYVVAFFAEDIAASSGPEMFGNLPGMIMELAIPRLHTTWVATHIELMSPADADFTMAEKGKKVSSKQLFETIQYSLKDWGKWGTRYIWLSCL
jgi:GLPGLI family protein